MLDALRRHASNIAVAAVTAAVVAGGPSIAATITNADKVDGKHAVSANATVANRAGKLVATDANGYLPDYLVRRARSATNAQNADTLDGWDSSYYLRGGTGVGVDDTSFLPSGASRSWTSANWPIGWQVQWSVIPGVYAGRMKLDVEILHDNTEDRISYILKVTNTGAYTSPYKVRYIYTSSPASPAAAGTVAVRKVLEGIKVKRFRE